MGALLWPKGGGGVSSGPSSAARPPSSRVGHPRRAGSPLLWRDEQSLGLGATCRFSCLHIPGRCSRRLGMAAGGLQAAEARAEQGSGKNRPPHPARNHGCPSFPGGLSTQQEEATLGPSKLWPPRPGPHVLCPQGAGGTGFSGLCGHLGTGAEGQGHRAGGLRERPLGGTRPPARALQHLHRTRLSTSGGVG